VPGGVPRNVYRTADGQWIVLSGTTDAQVARILTLLGEDTADMLARFGRSESRLAHSDQLDEMVARWVADEPRDQALKLLLDARIPAAPVNDVPAILSDPHVVARRNVVDVRDDCLGSVALVGPVPQLSATPGAIYSTGPGLGAHNREVYGDLLGLSDTDLEGLARQGIV
jgi:crotonobetainyl-CoA:carnitine CoA-transferase CaiB-like acyl-CoA transferase